MSDEADGTKDESPASAEPSDAVELSPGAEIETSAGSSPIDLGKTASFVGNADDDVLVADSESELDSESVNESVMVGASSAGAARAAARRSGVRSGTTVGKGVATRAREDTQVSKGGPVARLGRFLREVVAELRKVIWPARNQMVTYTIVVIVFVAFMVALVAGLDVGFAKGILQIFG